MADFAILVIGLEGEESYVCDGLGDRPTRFPSRAAAKREVDFLMIGVEGDVQSVNIVPYPKTKRSA
jgi:hypothetical protein